MRELPSFGVRPASGFTLIELMTVVLVVTLLTVIAVPSYLNQTRKAHRTEAKSILLDLAGREERFIATNGTYSSATSDLGFSTAWGQPVGSGYYTIAAPTVTAASASSSTTAATPAQFTITATANGAQANDTQCKTMTINQAGVQSSTDGTNPTSGCW